MTLPADMPLSTIAGTYTVAEVDNADTGLDPQGAPLDGLQIVLTPDPPRVWTHTTSGAGVAIGPMLATTNSLGVLVNPVTGLASLRIPSSAQAGLTGAPTIPWTAEISDPLGRVETERKTFHAPAGGTVNLPSAAPYWPDPNAGTLPQWERAREEATAAAQAAVTAADVPRQISDAIAAERTASARLYTHRLDSTNNQQILSGFIEFARIGNTVSVAVDNVRFSSMGTVDFQPLIPDGYRPRIGLDHPILTSPEVVYNKRSFWQSDGRVRFFSLVKDGFYYMSASWVTTNNPPV